MNRRLKLVAICLLISVLSTSTAFAGMETDSPATSDIPRVLDEGVEIDEIPDEVIPLIEEGRTSSPRKVSNRYYFKTEQTGKAKSVSKKVTKAQAKAVNGLTTALLGTISGAAASVAGGAAVVGWDFVYSMASQFFKSGIKEGTYKGKVYKVSYYKVDSLTGKKHKLKEGVRTTLTCKGSTITKTRWYK